MKEKQASVDVLGCMAGRWVIIATSTPFPRAAGWWVPGYFPVLTSTQATQVPQPTFFSVCIRAHFDPTHAHKANYLHLIGANFLHLNAGAFV